MREEMGEIDPQVTLGETAKLDHTLSPSTSRVLPYIPTEICHIIAQHLDLKSALRLMRACKTLSLAGEIRVYSQLDLMGSWIDCSHEDCVYISDEERHVRMAIVDIKLENTILALCRRPHRQAFIRSIRIEPSDGERCKRSTRIHELLSLSNKHLQTLEILPLALPPGATDTQCEPFSTLVFFSNLATGILQYNRLTRLKYVHPAEVTPPVWMMRMPNLIHIDISSAGGLCDISSAGGLFPDDTLGFSTMKTFLFPHLRHVTMNHVADFDYKSGYATVLNDLLHLVPNTVFLRIRGDWRVASRDPALKALGQLKMLKTVVALDRPTHTPGNNGLLVSRFGLADFSVEQAAFEYGQWTEWEELQFDNLILELPRAPALQRLSILTTARPPLSDYASVPLGPTQSTTSHIPSRFLHQLQRCPLLSSILLLHLDTPFPESYNANFVEPTYFYPSTEWIKDGHRGVIIRSFEDPHSTLFGTLWHLRVLSRAASNGGEHFVATRRSLRDWSRYKGRTVPREVLEAVYKEAGMDMHSMEGGRGLSLGTGNGAWRVLETWRDSSGEDSEAEDDFRLDGTEDDDLLSDEE